MNEQMFGLHDIITVYTVYGDYTIIIQYTSDFFFCAVSVTDSIYMYIYNFYNHSILSLYCNMKKKNTKTPTPYKDRYFIVIFHFESIARENFHPLYTK